MNVAVSAQDERAIEVLASGLPIHHGAQLAVDVTMRCAGPRQPRSSTHQRSCRARRDKELKYHGLVSGNCCALVVVAVETGGRWSSEAVDFVSSLAGAQARDAPPLLRRSSFLAWRRRWSRMLAVSCGRAFASSLVTSCSVTPDGQDGPPPDLADLLA